MATISLIRCDACGAEREVGKSGSPWYEVKPALTAQEDVRRLEAKVLAGEAFKDIADFGDFCSLRCLANWASAHHELRALEAEPEKPLSPSSA